MAKSRSSSAGASMDRPRLTAILEAHRSELLQIPREAFIAVTVPRDRVLELTEHVVASMGVYQPILEKELSAARAKERRVMVGQLHERAQAFYAADLLAAEAYTPAQEQERRRIIEDVVEHDRVLLKWARPLFGDDPECAALLDDIQRGTGHKDSAEDVIRLVSMFRSHWDEAEGQTPITREYLDRAEADATRLVEFLSGKDNIEARDLARRAFTAWARDYREIIALGRYLARAEADATLRFPGVHAQRSNPRRDNEVPEPGGEGSDDSDDSEA